MSAHHIAVENDIETGLRLKFWSQAADVDYWTDLWRDAGEQDYSRELTGHQPHQLTGTFNRWVPTGSRVLEAGCGLARFTVAANAQGYAAEGLDWSTGTVHDLRQRFPDIPWHVGDVRELQFADDEFDAVYSPGVVEHFEEGPRQILMETRRVLRRGGFAVISTPCLNRWVQRHLERVASVGTPDGEFYQYAFSPNGMKRVLTELGFDVVQMRTYGALATLMRHGGWRVPHPLVRPLALALDYLPGAQAWGSTCIWVARKR